MEWPRHRWVAALSGAVVAALAIGIPTGIIGSPFYTRMTPVLWWNYPVWLLTALLSGLVLATYVRPPATLRSSGSGRATAGGVLGFLAVGCPICNKVVVALVGLSGAMNVWAPVQPLLALVSLVLLAVAFIMRLRAERSCRLDTSRPADDLASRARSG